MAKGRLEAFSDGVLAVIITIMVLEIKVPHGTDLAALRKGRRPPDRGLVARLSIAIAPGSTGIDRRLVAIAPGWVRHRSAIDCHRAGIDEASIGDRLRSGRDR
jgi:hypothetical protein